MDEVTYRDPKVIELIRLHYVAVSVDGDSRPDLANRYEDYGWPATIVFGADRGEIVKRRGYIPPRPMASMLQAIIDDPTPGPSVLPEMELTHASAVGDANAEHDIYADDAICDYPQSGERILGRNNLQALRSHHPGKPSGSRSGGFSETGISGLRNTQSRTWGNWHTQ
jgi:Protein of unknown function, DUF255